MSTREVVVSEHEAAHGSPRSYGLGFGLSVILTVLAYLAASHHIWHGWALISAVIGLAVIQFVVQVLFFLHLSQESRPRWNLVVFCFMILVVLIVVIGSIWIMFNLNYHHQHHQSPHQTNEYIQHDEGIKT